MGGLALAFDGDSRGVLVSAVVGWATQKLGIRLPGASMSYSFGVANIGFLVGVLKAIFGKPILTYR